MSRAPADGDFYIDNTNKDFYLHEGGIWVLKGSLADSGAFGGGSNIFVDDGPPPSGGEVGQEILVGSGAPG